MPYYVYRIQDPKALEYLDQKDRYQDAKTLVRGLREGLATTYVAQIRMIFAQTRHEAETLLSAPKDQRVIGED